MGAGVLRDMRGCTCIMGEPVCACSVRVSCGLHVCEWYKRVRVESLNFSAQKKVKKSVMKLGFCWSLSYLLVKGRDIERLAWFLHLVDLERRLHPLTT